MNSITQNNRYLEHDLLTKFNACKLYASSKYSVAFIVRKYKISKASLMRWMKRFDGTKDSLISRSRRPKSPHPNAHTAIEIQNIENLLKRNSNIGLSELYGKLKQSYAYTRHPASLFRFLRKRGVFTTPEHKKKPYKPKKYDTPTKIGQKMQLDVKFVPKHCYSNWNTHKQKFYQYTIIDECSRERFIYAYDSYNADNTVDFVRRAIIYFGYFPKIIQTDNGSEFTLNKECNTVHFFDQFCNKFNIEHKLIRPYTPRHNGKVERSHRNDNVRFYSNLSFYSLDDLNKQMKDYLKRSNNIPSSSIKWMTPLEKRNSLLKIKHNTKSPLRLYETA